MIELMVVVLVISILIALILPAIGNASRNVRVTQVRGEISQLETALSQFKQRFQMDPPSRIVLWEDPSTSNGWNTASPSNDAKESRAFIRQMWPQFDFTATRNINTDGDTTDVITLTGGECLVFFLGGMLQSDGAGRVAPVGFSKNPLNPFVTGGNREGPFFEFKTERFSDVNSNGFPEYLDTLPGQTVPYLYHSSYDGAGYRVNATSVTVDEYTGGSYLSSPYLQGTSTTSPAFKPQAYQIVSPGFDKKFGTGGPFLADASVKLPPYGSVTATDREPERDNITNFHNGMLAP